MSEIGYDITRNGTTVHQLPDIQFNSVKWEQEPNTQTATSPFTKAGQTNELAGARWKATYTYDVAVGKDKNIGLIRAALIKLRGASGRFFGKDPTWCNGLGSKDKAETISITVNLPEIEVVGGNMYPELDRYPANTQYPNTGDGSYIYPAYSFTLTLSYDLTANYYLTSSLDSGSTSCNVNPINIESTFINSNPWDYSQGIRPEYDEALSNAEASIYSQVSEVLENDLLSVGDYIRIQDAHRMVVESVESGDTTITFEPPLIHPVNAGTKVETVNTGVIMRLIDDSQASFMVNSGQIHDKISFSAIEAL